MSRSFIGKCGSSIISLEAAKDCFYKFMNFFPFLGFFPEGDFPHRRGLFLPSNIVNKEGLDRSSILSFLKAHFQSKDLVPYLIPAVSKGCVCLFVWLLRFFLVGIRVCLLSHDDDSNGFMTFYELHVFQSIASTNSLLLLFHLQSLGGGSLWLHALSHNPSSSLLPSQHISAPLVYFLPRTWK